MPEYKVPYYWIERHEGILTVIAEDIGDAISQAAQLVQLKRLGSTSSRVLERGIIESDVERLDE